MSTTEEFLMSKINNFRKYIDTIVVDKSVIKKSDLLAQLYIEHDHIVLIAMIKKILIGADDNLLIEACEEQSGIKITDEQKEKIKLYLSCFRDCANLC